MPLFDSDSAREAAKRRWQQKQEKPASEEEIASLPRERLIELLQDKTTPGYVTVQAAKALAGLPDEQSDEAWLGGVQVRADFVPPSWAEVLTLAKGLGAFTQEDWDAAKGVDDA